jgi:hypothetical protein
MEDDVDNDNSDALHHLLTGRGPGWTSCPSAQCLRGPCCLAHRIWLLLGPAAEHQQQSPLGPTWRTLLCRPPAQEVFKAGVYILEILYP